MTGALKGLRLVSLLLFLTVFFLPLHFHPVAATAHVSKECGCNHASRTEMGLAPAEINWIPPIQQVRYEPFELQFFSGLIPTLQAIRGPPAL
jgi:hypothetical protein